MLCAESGTLRLLKRSDAVLRILEVSRTAVTANAVDDLLVPGLGTGDRLSVVGSNESWKIRLLVAVSPALSHTIHGGAKSG